MQDEDTKKELSYLRVYRKYLDGTPIWELATVFCVSMQEIVTALEKARSEQPQIKANDLARDLEITLQEEIGRLINMRRKAFEGYEETSNSTKTLDNESQEITYTASQRINLSAVASLSREIRETIKFLATIRGIASNQEQDKNVVDLILTLKEAPAADEFLRNRRLEFGKNSAGN